MADHATGGSPVQENIDTSQTNTDANETEIIQEEGTIEKPAPIKQFAWCFFCHRASHRPDDCPRGLELEVNEVDRWALLSSSHPKPILGEMTATIQVINMITLREVQIGDYRSYISDRDALFIRICRHSATHYATLLKWLITFMSLFNILVEITAAWLFDWPCKLVQSTFRNCAKSDENVLTFLHRASSANNVIGFTAGMEKIKTALKDLQIRFVTKMERFVAIARDKQDSGIKIWDLDSRSKSWIRKVVLTITNVQPYLESSDLYIVRFSYPSIDDVLRAGGLGRKLADDLDS